MHPDILVWLTYHFILQCASDDDDDDLSQQEAWDGPDRSKMWHSKPSCCTQAESLLKNPNSLNLTDILPNGVTFSNPKFFNNMASNVTSTSKVLLPSIRDGLRPSSLAATGCDIQQ